MQPAVRARSPLAGVEGGPACWEVRIARGKHEPQPWAPSVKTQARLPSHPLPHRAWNTRGDT